MEPLHVALPRASLPAARARCHLKALLRAGRNVQGAGRPKRSKYVVEAATCARTNFLSTTGLSTTDIPLRHAWDAAWKKCAVRGVESAAAEEEAEAAAAAERDGWVRWQRNSKKKWGPRLYAKQRTNKRFINTTKELIHFFKVERN